MKHKHQWKLKASYSPPGKLQQSSFKINGLTGYIRKFIICQRFFPGIILNLKYNTDESDFSIKYK